MNCRDDNFEVLIMNRMRLWLTVNDFALSADVGRRARRNFRRLIRKYPEIASAHGFSEEDVS